MISVEKETNGQSNTIEILGYKPLSNSTLLHRSKKDLIELIRLLEFNWSIVEESYTQSVSNAHKVFMKQNAEIERLTDSYGSKRVLELDKIILELRKEKAELQKQVDELTVKSLSKCDCCPARRDLGLLLYQNEQLTEKLRLCKDANEVIKRNAAELQEQADELNQELEKTYEIERANIQAEIADAGKSCHWCKQQPVKDTAKEIFDEIGDSDILVVETQEYGEIEVVPIERLKEIVKSKGVEVK